MLIDNKNLFNSTYYFDYEYSLVFFQTKDRISVDNLISAVGSKVPYYKNKFVLSGGGILYALSTHAGAVDNLTLSSIEKSNLIDTVFFITEVKVTQGYNYTLIPAYEVLSLYEGRRGEGMESLITEFVKNYTVEKLSHDISKNYRDRFGFYKDYIYSGEARDGLESISRLIASELKLNDFWVDYQSSSNEAVGLGIAVNNVFANSRGMKLFLIFFGGILVGPILLLSWLIPLGLSGSMLGTVISLGLPALLLIFSLISFLKVAITGHLFSKKDERYRIRNLFIWSSLIYAFIFFPLGVGVITNREHKNWLFQLILFIISIAGFGVKQYTSYRKLSKNS